jgi:hypothetical protein
MAKMGQKWVKSSLGKGNNIEGLRVGKISIDMIRGWV